jgi:hypothetical protein
MAWNSLGETINPVFHVFLMGNIFLFLMKVVDMVTLGLLSEVLFLTTKIGHLPDMLALFMQGTPYLM